MAKPFTSDVYSPQFLDADLRKAMESRMRKVKAGPLYVYRSVVNTKDITDWAHSQGFTSVVAPDDLHVTVIYSRNSIDWFKLGETWSGDKDGNITIDPGGPRAVEALGDKGAVVLMFASSTLSWRNGSAKEMGCSWDYDEYQPHITITYAPPPDIDLAEVEPYTGKIVLGPEMFEALSPGWSAQEDDATGDAPVAKRIFKALSTDDELGIVFGWAMVSSVDGNDYHDWNIDPDGEFVPEHIPDSTILKCTADFMMSKRAGNEMHAGPDQGMYVFGFPLTADIAKAMGVTSSKTGFMVGYKPNNKDVLEKFRTGAYSGFSIEGERLAWEEHNV